MTSPKNGCKGDYYNGAVRKFSKSCQILLQKLINRRASCIIEGRSVGDEELKSTLGWPNLQARRNYLKCLLVHKCLHGIAPSYLLSEFRHAHLYHGYNTRSRDLLRPPFAKTAKCQGSFRINGARTYNTIPRTIRQVEAFSEFQTKLKCYLEQ